MAAIILAPYSTKPFLLFFFFATLSLELGRSLATSRNYNRQCVGQITNTRTNSYDSARDAGVSIQPTEDNKGFGAFATALIPVGTRIGAYEGEYLTRSQVEARYWNKRKCRLADRRWLQSRMERNQGRSGDYLFDLGDNIFMDAEDTDISSWCRFMNHAAEDCNTCNVGASLTKQIKQGRRIVQKPSLWFEAIRDIQIGEELLYDYGDCYWD